MRQTTMRAAIVAIIAMGLSIIGVQTSQAAPVATAGGFNDFSCVPSDAHPAPVVMIHGFGAPADSNFSSIGPALAAEGYCGFAVNYGHTSPLQYPGGLAAMDDSAAEIAAFIDDVLEATGASEVDILGHSEGGLHSLYVPKKFGLGDTVGTVVALAPPTHGLDASGTLTIARTLGLPTLVKPFTKAFGCTACDELAIDEDFYDRLSDGPITQSGIDYTIIVSTNDRIVTPIETSFVDEPGVANLVVQDTCPFDPVGHVGLAFDTGVIDMITNALDPASASPVTCSFGLPL